MGKQGRGHRRDGYRVVEEERPFAAFLDGLELLDDGADETARFIHREIAEPVSVPKRNLLVLRKDEPVLATTLRRRGAGWDIATMGVACPLGIPHREGHLGPALAATGLDLTVRTLRTEPDEYRPAEAVWQAPWYGAELQSFDAEGHWAASGLLKKYNRTLRRRPDVTVVRDDPALLQWAISQWQARFRDDPRDDTVSADDLRRLWPELLRRGRLTVVALVEGDGTPCACQVANLDDGYVTAALDARLLEEPPGISFGTQVHIESMRRWKADGHLIADFGSGTDHHKSRIAPVAGTEWTVHYAPSARFAVRGTAKGLARRALLGMGMDPRALRRANRGARD